MKRLPLFGCKLAVAELGQTTFGILYDLLTGDLTSAYFGRGAEFVEADGRKTLVRTGKPVALYCVAGFLPLFLFANAEYRKLAWKLHVFDRVLSYRYPSRECRLLAEAGVDFFPAGRLKLWDHAAGEFVYRAAENYSEMLAEGLEYSPTPSYGWSGLRKQFEDIFSQPNRIGI